MGPRGRPPSHDPVSPHAKLALGREMRYVRAQMLRLLPAALALAAALACAGRVHPSRARIDPSRREEVVARAKRELAAQGFAVAEANAAAGVVRTAWLEHADRVPCGSVQCPYRDRVLVRIAADATVSVELERQIWVVGVLPDPAAPAWAVPPARSRDALVGVAETQEELLAAIVE